LKTYLYIIFILRKKSTCQKTMNHKPGSVAGLKRPARTAIYLRPALRPAFMQPTRSIGRAALLLLDFAPDEVCRPVLLPVPRWALTPPFHPYRASWPLNELPRCMAVYSLLRCLSKSRKRLEKPPGPPPGCYPASCPAEPGLSSLTSTIRLIQSGSLVHRTYSFFIVAVWFIVLFFFLVLIVIVVHIVKV